jgi:hypothetical protein
MPTTIRDLTFEERSVFGECPVCKAKDGEPCDSRKGINLADGNEGAHLGRLIRAPRRVAITMEPA